MASRVAWASIAAASGSLAVAAEMVHNLVDLVASVTVLAGVKISEREGRAFAYGLHKVENVVGVMRMRLIESLKTDGSIGRVSYRFRPSSPLCPLAVRLALDIRQAVSDVPGVPE